MNEEALSLHGDRVALVVQDKATYWLYIYPDESKRASSVHEALKDLTGPDEAQVVYTDGVRELDAGIRSMVDEGYQEATQYLKLRHHTATENRPQTNGVAERAVRRTPSGERSRPDPDAGPAAQAQQRDAAMAPSPEHRECQSKPAQATTVFWGC